MPSVVIDGSGALAARTLARWAPSSRSISSATLAPRSYRSASTTTIATGRGACSSSASHAPAVGSSGTGQPAAVHTSDHSRR